MNDSSSKFMSSSKPPIFNNVMYDHVKWVAQYGLPGVGSLYFGLAQIWGLPYAVEIVGTISLLDVFLGILLGISSRTYNNSVKMPGEAKYDGILVVDKSDPKKDVFSLVVSSPVDEISTAESITLKVENPSG